MTNPHTPKHIAIIMDGNRRWAEKRKMPKTAGHAYGYRTLKKCLEWCRDFGVITVTVYAFSTENWKRTDAEKHTLFELLERGIDEIAKEKIHVRFIGERNRFPSTFQQKMKELEKRSSAHKKFTLVIALSYGGRAEILTAAKLLSRKGTKIIEHMDEKSFGEFLWTKDIPDPDMIIRTGGEKRLSNFLLWQGSYSELFFSDTLWPDFSKKELYALVKEYTEREKRHGA